MFNGMKRRVTFIVWAKSRIPRRLLLLAHLRSWHGDFVCTGTIEWSRSWLAIGRQRDDGRISPAAPEGSITVRTAPVFCALTRLAMQAASIARRTPSNTELHSYHRQFQFHEMSRIARVGRRLRRCRPKAQGDSIMA